jgi:hypothetical protein
MIFFVLVLLLIIFSSAKAQKAGAFNADYISRDKTNNIKGIFVILILLSHAKSYLELGGAYDEPYIAMQNHLNQMVVAMFLFYSGFGIMEQIKKREFTYIKSIPLKRFPNLLINFDIAVILYFILNFAIGNKLELKNALLALIGWVGVLNSSWYIFVTFVLYILTFISFFAIKWIKNRKAQFVYLIILTALTAAFVFVMLKYSNKERFWYNTALLYVLGFWYSYFKDVIEKVLMKNDGIFFTAFALLLTVYLFTYLHRWDRLLIYTVWACCFTIGVVMLTMKFDIESNILKWFGEHIFSIYILQRIPMVILVQLGIADRHKYIFVILSIAATIPLAITFDYLTGKLSKLIWKKA